MEGSSLAALLGCHSRSGKQLDPSVSPSFLFCSSRPAKEQDISFLFPFVRTSADVPSPPQSLDPTLASSSTPLTSRAGASLTRLFSRTLDFGSSPRVNPFHQGGSSGGDNVPSVKTSGVDSGSDALEAAATVDAFAAGFRLGDLHESMLPGIFLHLSPQDLLSVSAVSTTFHSACQLDSVWGRHLPPCAEAALAAAWPKPIRSGRSLECIRLLAEGLFLDKGRQWLHWDPQRRHLALSIGVSEASRTQCATILRGASRQDWKRLQDLPGARFETSVLLKHMGGYDARIQNVPLPPFLSPGQYTLGWRLRLVESAKGVCFSGELTATVSQQRVADRTRGAQSKEEEGDGPWDPLCSLSTEVSSKLPSDSWETVPIGTFELPGGSDRRLRVSATLKQPRHSEQPAILMDCLVLQSS